MSSPEEYLQIDTPENVVFGYEIVGIGSRFLAALIDTMLIALALVPINVAAYVMFMRNSGQYETTLVTGILIFIGFVLLWGYYIFFELSWNGRTPGKKTLNLRVIRQDGMPITVTESIIRNLVRLVDFLPVAYGLGVVAMFIDSKSRRLGDLAAGTLVVRDQEEVTLESLKKSTTPAVYNLRAPGQIETEARDWPVHLLTEVDIQLAESFLQRHRDLRDPSILAWQIINRLTTRMELPPVSSAVDHVYAISAILKTYRKWQQESNQ